MTDKSSTSTNESQTTQSEAMEPEADHDERAAGEQRAKAGRRPRIALDHDEGSYAITPERRRQ